MIFKAMVIIVLLASARNLAFAKSFVCKGARGASQIGTVEVTIPDSGGEKTLGTIGNIKIQAIFDHEHLSVTMEDMSVPFEQRFMALASGSAHSQVTLFTTGRNHVPMNVGCTPLQ